MTGRAAIPLAAVLALLAGAPGHAAVQLPTHFINEVVRTGFDEPSSFAFLPDGRVVLCEQRTGKLRLIVNGQIATTDPLTILPSVLANAGERGVLGIAVDPRWPDFPYLYAFYNRVGGMRLVRYLASEDVTNPNGGRLILSAARVILDSIPDQAGNHNAGCLRFGPDGMLYVALGDDAAHCDAGDSTTMRGQILRLDVERLPIYGGPKVPLSVITPADNPFVDSPDSSARLVYAFGLRNPFRFHIDPVLGSLFVADVGDSDFEEISEVSAGDFLGWPWREGHLVRVRADCPEPGGPGARPSRAPIAVEEHVDSNLGYAIISAGVYRPVIGGTANWPPEYYTLRGDVFYGQYYEGYLRRLSWDGTQWGAGAPVPGQPNPTDWATGLLNAADFNVGPDGSLWWLQQWDEFYSPFTGTLYRIRYVGPPTSVDPEPLGARPLAAFPNPSRGEVELSFGLASAGTARLEIFDLSGRRVRILLDGPAPAGRQHLRWDGAGEGGAPVEAGVYFARLTRAGGPAITTRVLRLR